MLQRPVVIDANVLIEDALRRTSGRHCSLQFAAETGTARLFAPLQLLPEVMNSDSMTLFCSSSMVKRYVTLGPLTLGRP